MYFLSKPVLLTWSISEKFYLFFIVSERIVIIRSAGNQPFRSLVLLASYSEIHFRVDLWFEQVPVTADTPFTKKQTLPRSPSKQFMKHPAS